MHAVTCVAGAVHARRLRDAGRPQNLHCSRGCISPSWQPALAYPGRCPVDADLFRARALPDGAAELNRFTAESPPPGRVGVQRDSNLEPAEEESLLEEFVFPWRDRPGGPVHSIHCVKSGKSGPAVVCLHGFGVSCTHFERNFAALARHARVFSLDFLGQGNSWPDSEAAAAGLQLSPALWTRLVGDFVAHVIRKPAVLVGNSLGGYVAVQLAAESPDSVAGLALLNASPFWAWAPNAEREPRRAALAKRLGLWDGTLPAPSSVTGLMESLWFGSLRRPETIAAVLKAVYASEGAIGDELVASIVGPARRPLAVQAFASIICAPKMARSFDEAVAALAASRVPVLLLYGKDDPWVVPLWGQRLKRALGSSAAYYEVTPAGHCPHHEAPAATNAVLLAWLASLGGGGAMPLQPESESESDPHGWWAAVAAAAFGPGPPRMAVRESDGRVSVVRRRSGAPGGANLCEWVDYARWVAGRER